MRTIFTLYRYSAFLSLYLQTLLLVATSFTSSATAFAPLSPDTLQLIPRPSDTDFNVVTGKILAPILIPRVPGTENSLKVLQHFRDFFANELPDWKVSTQNSTQATPLSKGKKVPFVNFFATRDPPWASLGDVGRLVLVAHYDSLVAPEGFIGATDSAVPCALILQAARAVDKALERRWARMQEAGDEMEMEEERGVMVLLLDGEEAWESWSDTDSLYGARDLAAHWEDLHHPPMSTRKTHISNIDLFVLFDLLGTAAPNIPSYFPTTHWAYSSFAALEKSLRDQGLFRSHKANPKVWFTEAEKDRGRWYGGMVQDDHLPFMIRGVEVLHLIPSPFPRVWHTMDDDGEHMDADTIGDWGMLMTAWLVGELGLEKDMGTGKPKRGLLIPDYLRGR